MTQQYKITSDVCSLGKRGAIVSLGDDSGVNIDALIEGEHITPVAAKQTKEAEASTEAQSKEK